MTNMEKIDEVYTFLETFNCDYRVAAEFLKFIGCTQAPGQIVKKLESLNIEPLVPYIVEANSLSYTNIKFWLKYR